MSQMDSSPELWIINLGLGLVCLGTYSYRFQNDVTCNYHSAFFPPANIWAMRFPNQKCPKRSGRRKRVYPAFDAHKLVFDLMQWSLFSLFRYRAFSWGWCDFFCFTFTYHCICWSGCEVLCYVLICPTGHHLLWKVCRPKGRQPLMLKWYDYRCRHDLHPAVMCILKFYRSC